MNKLTLNYLCNYTKELNLPVFTHTEMMGARCYKIGLSVSLLLLALPNVAVGAQPSPLRVVVNSNQDGAVQPDDALTLREAIEIVNGTLPVDRLSDREKTQVQFLNAQAPSRIEFNLPPQQNTIRLTQVLPPLTSPGLVIDGAQNPLPVNPEAEEISIPTPVIAITPAPNTAVFRGLTVAADAVTIRGLSLYGFTSAHRATASTPPADIFIAPTDTSQKQPPKDVLIENNWLGVPPSSAQSSPRSAFGVYVFNSLGTTIQNNLIANHDGSAIITSVRAENLQVKQNVITGNGFAGMPDAIRLEGVISHAQVTANLIRDNAGSAVYLFKPNGLVKISNNTISQNGQQLRRAAIYLMGNNHQVVNNKISDQSGAGVVVAAYPQSRGSRIQNNQFAQLGGLSIDLVSQQNVSAKDYQQGDGLNPVTNSYQRHRKTGNFGINAPRFLSSEFFLDQQKGTVTLDGIATPGSVVEIYRASENTVNPGSLTEVISTINVDANGRFSSTLGNLKPGEQVSAIATHPEYGTSEPAVNAVVRSLTESAGR